MKKTRGLVLVLSPAVVGILWLLISAFLYLIAPMDSATPSMFIVIKNIANRSLWILGLLSAIAMIVGIVLLSTNHDAKITVKEAISYGWKNSKKHMTKFLLWFWILIVLQVINGFFTPAVDEPQTILSFIVTTIINILNLWITLWFSQIALDIVYGKKYSASSLFVGMKKTFNYIIAYIINAIIILLGFVLLIVPGIIRTFRLSLVQYLILDKNYGPWKAIKTSRRISKWFVTDMFAISLIGWLINILGVLALLVGMLRTVPLLLLANAYVYKRISEINKHMLTK